jgi:formylglycine-generating enzyme required for sulfatase activity
MRWLAIAALSFAVTAALAQKKEERPDGQTSGRRIALVAGNSAYSRLPALPGVVAEAESIRNALRAADFEVTPLNNARYEDMVKAIDGFVSGVQSHDVCIFYFSGYASQDGEDDFLLPIDFDSAVDTLDNSNAYPVSVLARNLEVKQPAFKALFIEGARKFESKLSNARPGLRIPYTGDLTEVLFAIPTVSDRFIETPPGEPPLFTKALVSTMERQGLPFAGFMTEVLKEVMGTMKSQQPAFENKVTKEFYFHAPPPPAPAREPVITRRQNRTDREFYVLIPAGAFLMGCVPSDSKCDKQEKPQHKVTLTKGFWMGENEVRVDSYRRFKTAVKKPKDMPKPFRENDKWRAGDHPINNMKWEDANAYCSWAGGRLPTEAEWEFAARAMKENQIYPLDPTDPKTSRDKANFYGAQGSDIFEFTAPVRSFDANPFGLYDMAGNVWELVSDFFGIYPESPVTDPQGPAKGKAHVKRGGSYDSNPKDHLRISVREPFSQAWVNVGFRCVLEDTPETQNKTLQNP